jgi:hypothetical protein
MSLLDYYKGYELTHAYIYTKPASIAATAAATNKLNATAHGLAEGDEVVLTSHVTLANVTDGLRYYVKLTDADNFQLALTSGGSAIAIGNTGSAVIQPYTITELDWTKQAKTTTDRNTFEWNGSARYLKLETIKQQTVAIDQDCIPTAAHKRIFGKSTISSPLLGGMTPASAVGFGGGNDKSGVSSSLLLTGYGLKSEAQSVVNIAVLYPSGILSLVAAPGFTSGAVQDAWQYSYAATCSLTDVCGGTTTGASSDGEIYYVSEY